ncbi:MULTISPECIES: hypothetical protein [unclassified Ensifer]|uniref:hypothetical protein n=1 Tax=unclassified Ensifer TaxID=2633371 RepID=UPI000812E33D|nr:MULTISPECIES: hypothetical protein [unclassified Ensifer]OCP17021.1 hypothetical protein BC360_12345 [Ensifer sp. LC163]OCP24150.1 hypothetical protein BC363_23230 [Ensifer sp. LC384]OCP25617.1 hypothetical protein BC361_17465 [Ensifer sp. LC54]
MTPATILDHDGIGQPITEWALDYGITPAIIIGRLERGATIADAITTPMQIGLGTQRLPIFSPEQLPASRRKGTSYWVNGVSKTLTEWAAHVGISRTAFLVRLGRMPIEEAVALAPRSKTARKHPGVVLDFTPSKGTGAGKALEERPNLTFSQEAAE